MKKPKGEVFIAIGSILMIIASSFGILVGILLMFAGAWLFTLLGATDMFEVGAAGIIGTLGAGVGIIVIVVAVLGLIFSIMCFKRKGDPRRATFPLVIGIIFSLFAMISLISEFSFGSVIALVAPALILVGAILNKQSLGEMANQPAYPVYPQQGQPYQPPSQPYQQPYQPPYQQPPYPEQPQFQPSQEPQQQYQPPQEPQYQYQPPEDTQKPQD